MRLEGDWRKWLIDEFHEARRGLEEVAYRRVS
jgi:hypothetical protein